MEDRYINTIEIRQLRWHDRVCLVADWKIADLNKIKVNYHTYPNPFYISGSDARTYPLEQIKAKSGQMVNMRAIPVSELSTVPFWARWAKDKVEQHDRSK